MGCFCRSQPLLTDVTMDHGRRDAPLLSWLVDLLLASIVLYVGLTLGKLVDDSAAMLKVAVTLVFLPF